MTASLNRIPQAPGNYLPTLHSDTQQATSTDLNPLQAKIAQLEKEIAKMIPESVNGREVANWNAAGQLLDSGNKVIGTMADKKEFQTKVQEYRKLIGKTQTATKPLFQLPEPNLQRPRGLDTALGLQSQSPASYPTEFSTLSSPPTGHPNDQEPLSNWSDIRSSLPRANNVNPARGFQPSLTASEPSGLYDLSSLRNFLPEEPHHASRVPSGGSHGTSERGPDISTAPQPSQSLRPQEMPANIDRVSLAPTSVAHSSAIDYDDLKNTQFLKEKLKQLKQEKEETEKFIKYYESERNGGLASLLVRLHTFGLSNGNEDVDEEIAELSKKISRLEDDINDINDMLTKNTKEKAERIAVLVLQQECIDVENTIKDKNITIGGKPLQLDVKSYFTLHELKEGKKNETTLEAKKKELEVHHKYLTQRLEAIKLLSS